jgi:serine/threonine protein kinase
MDTSKFNLGNQPAEDITEAEPVAYGSTSICYRLRYYGKLLMQKRLRPELADDPRYLFALKKEFELGIQLEHPNIVRYLNFHQEGKDVYILTDYVEGNPLSTLLSGKAKLLSDRRWQRQFISEFFSAIDYLHQRQILHLDLKPDNIMITSIGNHVKLIDLGFAYQDCYPSNYGGTPQYSAPELFDRSKGSISQATDIYAIGRILQEMHIGSKSIIERCSNQDASKRYQSISELNKALNRSRRYVGISVLGILVAVCLSSILWFTYNDSTPKVKPSENIVAVPKVAGKLAAPNNVKTTANVGIADNHTPIKTMSASSSKPRKIRDKSQSSTKSKESETNRQSNVKDFEAYKAKMDNYLAPLWAFLAKEPQYEKHDEASVSDYIEKEGKVYEEIYNKILKDPRCKQYINCKEDPFVEYNNHWWNRYCFIVQERVTKIRGEL